MFDATTQTDNRQSQRATYSRSTQCNLVPSAVNISVQTEASFQCQEENNHDVSNECASDSEGEEETDNSEWRFSGACNSDTDSDDNDRVLQEDLKDNDSSPHLQRKFLVFESCLLQLMALCSICLAQCTVTINRICGSMVILKQRCVNDHIRIWSSQPSHCGMPYGNLASAASVLFNGCSPVKFLNICHHLRIPMISLRTFNRMQSLYLVPAVKGVWTRNQHHLLEAKLGQNCTVGGDARCCSPGHTAKFASYSVMDLETYRIMDVKLVQVNEVKNSNAMELEGLKRCLEFLAKYINITDIITDRHVMVKKFLREEMPHIRHWFDVWHVAKNI